MNFKFQHCAIQYLISITYYIDYNKLWCRSGYYYRNLCFLQVLKNCQHFAIIQTLIILPLKLRYRSKPEIPAVVPGMGNNYKPGQQKKTAPPGKDTEYYV